MADGSAAARAHLRTLAAAPRPAGSAAEAAARAHARETLRRLGYVIDEMPFAYSALVGQWGTPIGGVASMLVLGVVARLGATGRPAAALALMGAAVVAGGAIGAWAARRGVLSAPALRRSGVNLVATRGDARPTVWLVAHLDSKSQPVPIGVRAAGVIATIVAWVAALALAGAQQWGDVGLAALWPWIAAFGAIAGVPVAASIVTARSPGALDDASGVATVLLAAEALRDLSAAPGVLLTSAEELGLAGARAWTALRRAAGEAPGIALNVDGVDDVGALTVMTGVQAPPAVVAALRAGAETAGLTIAVRRLVPGILVDAVALADAGWATVTLSRGNWGTLARIHTSQDTVDRLHGTGVDEAARVLAAAARALIGAAPGVRVPPAGRTA
ncbi:MAG: M28 family peptidase [Gemmatirosa sp.]